jgi:hypothetical protein
VWITSDETFFLPVRVLRLVFRGKLLSKIERAIADGRLAFAGDKGAAILKAASRRTWVVYAKAPLAGPEHVVRYISRYTHRIAISNSRLVAYDGANVTFSWRDRADGNHRKTLRLDAVSFCRRFISHVLPPRLVRIRHYGLLSNRSGKALNLCRALLGGGEIASPVVQDDEDWVESCKRILGRDPLACPACESGRMSVVDLLPRCPPSIVPSPRPP